MLSSIKKTWHFRDFVFAGGEVHRKKVDVSTIKHGSVVTFGSLEQKELSHEKYVVGAPTTYHFHGNRFTSFPLYTLEHDLMCYMIISIQSEEAPYLAISKLVSGSDVSQLCIHEDYEKLTRGEMPPHLYVREQAAHMRHWLYMHYETKLSNIRGTTVAPDDEVKTFDYTLYVSSKDHKALEIERYPSGELLVYATIFRPASDIIAIEQNGVICQQQHIREEEATSTQESDTPPGEPVPPKTARHHQPFVQEHVGEPEELTISRPKIKQRPDQKEKDSAEIFELPMTYNNVHNVASIPTTQVSPIMPRDKGHHVKCNLRMASKLVDEALRNDMRVSDVIRKALGLNVNQVDYVMFDLQLSERDYKVLAERFDLDITNKEKIHELIMEELGHFTGEPDGG